MGTRSFIGILRKDGTVRAAYSHWDGYVDHHGPILINHYNTEEKINALLDHGDMSSLAEEIGEKHPFDDRSGTYDNMCTFYGRDRGEEDVDARVYSSKQEFLDKCHEDYTYLFDNGQWFVRHWHSRKLYDVATLVADPQALETFNEES